MSKIERFREWAGRRAELAAISSADSVFVIGLGRFGTSLSATLCSLGIEVLAVDTDQELVNKWADKLTHVRRADATLPSTLVQLGVKNFDAAVVAIGTGIEASVLTTSALSDLEVNNIWAKAITNEHGRILERVGAHHVVYPEKQMGERVAHIVTGQVIDYFQLDEGFVLAELTTPASLVGTKLGDSDLRQRFAVTVVCIKPQGKAYTYATPDSILGEGDLLVVAGSVVAAERFTDFASHP